MKTVILIPTYNESENIEKLVSLIFELQPNIYIKVIDDNSPDGTGNIVKSIMQKFPKLSLLSRKGKEGLGKAYTHGFREVLKNKDTTHVIMMDADFSHHPKYLSEMILKSVDYSVVIGSRYIYGGGTKGWELWRRILSRGANLYCRLITGLPIKDCTGGFNIINIDLLKKIDFSKMDASGYAFIQEIKYTLHKAGGVFYEVPIIFENRLGGESKMSGHIMREGIIAPWKMRWKNYSKK